MTINCKGITLIGKPCNRKVTIGDYCYQHRKEIFRQKKPSKCCVCYDPLSNQKYPLICGHWIHKDCIVASAKAECPLCRKQLNLGLRDMRRIKELAEKRTNESLQEIEDNLREEYGLTNFEDIINIINMIIALEDHYREIFIFFPSIHEI